MSGGLPSASRTTRRYVVTLERSVTGERVSAIVTAEHAPEAAQLALRPGYRLVMVRRAAR